LKKQGAITNKLCKSKSNLAIAIECASTYHQLGAVAQELREFEEARRNYQQALQIKIEFGDRYYVQAPTTSWEW
jgi:Tfp pilus assembly protein PilF